MSISDKAVTSMRKLYETVLNDKNRIYYLIKFEEFDRRDHELKASWNWPAFICPGAWALYRKMYGAFFALFFIGTIATLFQKGGSPDLSAILFIGSGIVFSIYANSLYHNSIKKKIAAAQLSVDDEPRLLELLTHKGGVNTWVIWVFGILPVIGILAAIAIPAYTTSTSPHANATHLVNPFAKPVKAASESTIHPSTQAWLDRNPWFNTPEYDQATRRTRAIDQQMHDEGYRAEYEHYFKVLDRRLIEAGIVVSANQ